MHTLYGAMPLGEIIARYGSAAVFLGTLAEGATVVLLADFAAQLPRPANSQISTDSIVSTIHRGTEADRRASIGIAARSATSRGSPSMCRPILLVT
jgi:hypothetical protein